MVKKKKSLFFSGDCFEQCVTVNVIFLEEKFLTCQSP